MMNEEVDQSQPQNTGLYFGSMATGLVHDLNNLLMVMVGRSELLAGSFSPDEAQSQHLNSVIEAVKKAAKLTEKLVELSSPNSKQKKIVNLNENLINIKDFLLSLLGEEIEVNFATSAESLTIEVDLNALEQLIVSLINYSKASLPIGGILKIATHKISEYSVDGQSFKGLFAVLEVIDNGIGQDHSVHGTEVLANIRELVSKCGAHLNINSKPWAGSTYEIFFKICDEAEQVLDLDFAQEAELASINSQQCILVVEDEPEVLMFLTAVLKKNGFIVLEAGDGVEALKICQKYSENIDLLVTDVVMPKLGGKSLFNAVHCLRPDIKALYITGYTEDDMRARGMSQEDNNILHKPFLAADLLKTVVGMLAQAQT